MENTPFIKFLDALKTQELHPPGPHWGTAPTHIVGEADNVTYYFFFPTAWIKP